MSLILAGARLAELDIRPPTPTAHPAVGGFRANDEEEEVPEGPPEAPPVQIASAPVAFLAAVAARVPAETITAYVAVQAIVFDPRHRFGQILLAAVLVLVTPAVEYVSFAQRKSRSGRPVFEGFRSVPWLDLVIATVAFVVWLSALPSSVFGIFSWYSQAYGSGALIIASLVFGQIDRARNIRWI